MDNSKLAEQKQIKEKEKMMLARQEMSVSTSSPLPPPEWMERYYNTDANIVKIILDQYKENSELVRKCTEKEIKLKCQSQWQGWIVAILILLCAVFCAYIEQKEVALGFLVLSIGSIVNAIIRK